MLSLDLKRLFTLKNIIKPYGFLLNKGFTTTQSQNFSARAVKTIRIDNIYRLCVMLNCTPNDLFSLSPEAKKSLPENHPLLNLIHEAPPDITKIISSLPPEKLTELSKHIESLSK